MNIDLTDDWYGWRVRGRYLVADDGQRMSPERLRGLLFRDAQELRLAGFQSRRKAEAGKRDPNRAVKIKVVIIDLADYRVHGLAAS